MSSNDQTVVAKLPNGRWGVFDNCCVDNPFPSSAVLIDSYDSAQQAWHAAITSQELRGPTEYGIGAYSGDVHCYKASKEPLYKYCGKLYDHSGPCEYSLDFDEIYTSSEMSSLEPPDLAPIVACIGTPETTLTLSFIDSSEAAPTASSIEAATNALAACEICSTTYSQVYHGPHGFCDRHPDYAINKMIANCKDNKFINAFAIARNMLKSLGWTPGVELTIGKDGKVTVKS